GGALPGATLLRTPLDSCSEAHAEPGLAAGSGAGVELLLLDAPALYGRPGNPYVDAAGRDHPDNLLRFGLLSRVAALLSAPASPLGWRPEALLCNDWQTALAPAFLHYLHGGRGAASL